ncbi:Legume lectin domain [Dillenia turbinata]|uniref:non-specific serine/threonine protein kinase n=1 Tax=Dillenia turbinata TaxID=194707 RepID=A0AAN8W7R4_9MAGN
MASLLCFLSVLLIALFPLCFSDDIQFIFNGFNDSNLITQQATVIRTTGSLKLTNKSHNVIGHAFYPDPIKIFDSSTKNISSFSTCFVFLISPSSDEGGYGLAFTISPESQFLGAESGHFMGIFNSTNDGNSSNHIVAVEFDTVKGYKETSDVEGNHVGINVNGMDSNASTSAMYYDDRTRGSTTEEINLEGAEPIQAWIDYDGLKKLLNVTIAPLDISKPTHPLLSFDIDLSQFLLENSYVGFSASTGKTSSSHYILGWSFQQNGVAQALNASQLPLPPNDSDKSKKYSLKIEVLLGLLSAVVLFLLGILFFGTLYRRLRNEETLEDWELECPHRFHYRDLHLVTKGFKESELIGVGGFGAVYKGVLPVNGAEIAVKRISRNSFQGVREFAAEIESLGRLRHKHLVNLQGWCKRKNDLLLVYDYIPCGSLDSLLFKPQNDVVLSWEHRFNIVKGVASGLLYLHEEWEQVVIHRDIKSGNVLIDGNMDARLGDFGLARLYDRGENSHTTNVVGTVGYIAPELARTGQASTSTDVFAYGVLLLEVVCGCRPIDPNARSGHMLLVDWVGELYQKGQILDAVDPKLNSEYVVREAELVLKLGLFCAHVRPESRPGMRNVVRFLNGDDRLPVFEYLYSFESARDEGVFSKFLEMVSSDTNQTLNYSSSVGHMSSISIEGGR